MNQTEAVRAFAQFLCQRLTIRVTEGAVQDIADKWCEAQHLPPGRRLNELAGEIKPAPMA